MNIGRSTIHRVDLPLSLDGPFQLWGYGHDANLLMLRHLGDYPTPDNDGEEDDSFVPQVSDVVFHRVRALAIRQYYRTLYLRRGTAAETGSLTQWIAPQAWHDSRVYVLGEDLDSGWLIATHVLWTQYTLHWYDPSPLLTQLPGGDLEQIGGDIYIDR